VYFYVLAQGEIGAARTSAYYAVSPFVGVLLSLLIFRQMPGSIFWAALIIMGVGVYFNIQDTNETVQGVSQINIE
jgi:drug/metabolite transporter (DMT)-like permease